MYLLCFVIISCAFNDVLTTSSLQVSRSRVCLKPLVSLNNDWHKYGEHMYQNYSPYSIVYVCVFNTCSLNFISAPIILSIVLGHTCFLRSQELCRPGQRWSYQSISVCNGNDTHTTSQAGDLTETELPSCIWGESVTVLLQLMSSS